MASYADNVFRIHSDIFFLEGIQSFYVGLIDAGATAVGGADGNLAAPEYPRAVVLEAGHVPPLTDTGQRVLGLGLLTLADLDNIVAVPCTS